LAFPIRLRQTGTWQEEARPWARLPGKPALESELLGELASANRSRLASGHRDDVGVSDVRRRRSVSPKLAKLAKLLRMKVLTAIDAKNCFGEMIDMAQAEPVRV